MLSDTLHTCVPQLLGATYDYLREKDRFDYGQVGQRLTKTLAELIVLAEEIDHGWEYEQAGEDIASHPMFKDFREGRYLAVIEKYGPAFAKERAKFKAVFEEEMKVRAALSQAQIQWITPEIALPRMEMGRKRSAGN